MTIVGGGLHPAKNCISRTNQDRDFATYTPSNTILKNLLEMERIDFNIQNFISRYGCAINRISIIINDNSNLIKTLLETLG